MSNPIPIEIVTVIQQVCAEHHQQHDLSKRIETYFRNVIEDNVGPGDLQRLIEAIHLREGAK